MEVGSQQYGRRCVKVRTALLGIAWLLAAFPVAIRAQEETPVCPIGDSVSAKVQSRILSLSLAERTRLPYGRDITLLIGTSDSADAVTVRYAVSGGRDGPRSGKVEATNASGGKCWTAAIPPLHVNEIVTLTIDRLGPPAFRDRRTTETLVADFILALANLDYPLSPPDFRTATAAAADSAVAANVKPPLDHLVIVTPDGTTSTLADTLGQLAGADLQVASVADYVVAAADKLARNLAIIVTTGVTPKDSGCTFTSDLLAVRDSAQALKDAGKDGVSQRLATGSLPWPACTRALVDSVKAEGEVRERELRPAKDGVIYLTSSQALSTVRDMVRRARALSRLVVSTGTINVPIGADLLERYTQADLVTGYLPSAGMWQTFGTVTFYAFSVDRSGYTASVSPRTRRERLALQLGYPVGNPIVSPKVKFEPSSFVAVMYRLNGLLSVSLGMVFGKSDPGAPCLPFKNDSASSCHAALSTNLDVSNLSLFQQLFARKDR